MIMIVEPRRYCNVWFEVEVTVGSQNAAVGGGFFPTG